MNWYLFLFSFFLRFFSHTTCCQISWIKFNFINFFNMFSRLYFFVHFFDFLFQLFLFLVLLTIFIINFFYLLFLLIYLIILFFFNSRTKVQIFKFSHYPNIIKLVFIANDLWMSKLRSVVCLEIRELFEESRNLCDNSKEIVWSGVIMHLKPFNCFIILDDRIKWLFLQFLPILA